MRAKPLNRIHSLFPWLAMLLGCAWANLPAATINVFAAASLTDSLKEIAAAFQTTSGDKVSFNLGSSSLLARQIEEGAPADLFFSADEAKMNALEEKRLILKETRRSRLSNALVIVVNAERGAPVQSPRDLATEKVKRLALAETKTVPAGIYAKEYLQTLGLWNAVERKVIPTENVRAALAAVEAGNVDAGIVYRTDAAFSRAVRVAFQVPPNEGPAISYPVAVVREAREPEAAKRFLRHLESESAAVIFERFGFIVRK